MQDARYGLVDSIIIEEENGVAQQEQVRASEIYGRLTFTSDVMLKRLPPEVFMTLEKTSTLANRSIPRSPTPSPARCASGRSNTAAPTTATGSSRSPE